MHMALFGSSIVSAYWNGAATYYRGILRAMARRGHTISFYEPDAFDRQAHRDMPDPAWARVVVYNPCDLADVERCVDDARAADLIVKCSGVGVNDAYLERAIAERRDARTASAFWDVDAPATLDRMRVDTADPLRELIPRFDVVLTYGGGEPVIDAYLAMGARACVPIYNGVDPETHHRVAPADRFSGLLGFLGNRMPDREQRVQRFFFDVAQRTPSERFVLGGNGWHDRPMPPNVAYLGHVYTHEHNAFNSTPLALLNIARESMARYGFSPATRVFEACGAAACLITDHWRGIEQFLEPGREVLVAHDGDELAELLRDLTPKTARHIGGQGRRRVLAGHTYDHRAVQLEHVLDGGRRAVVAGRERAA